MKYHNKSGIERAKLIRDAGYPPPEEFAEGQVWYDMGGHKTVIIRRDSGLWAYYYFNDGRYFRKSKINGRPGNMAVYSPTEKELERWETSKDGALNQ